jgi:ketosteroid isomerase-like protein
MSTMTAVRPDVDVAEPWDVQRVEGFFDALNQHDAQALMKLLAEHAVWKVRIDGRGGPVFEGRAEILKMLTGSMIRSEGTLTVEIEGLTVGDHEALAVGRMRASRDGRRLDARYSFALRLEHGLIVEVIETPKDGLSHRRYISPMETRTS